MGCRWVKHGAKHEAQQLNSLCSSTYPKGCTHCPGSYSELVWRKAAVLPINPELHQSRLKIFISETKSWIPFPLEFPTALLQWHYCMHGNVYKTTFIISSDKTGGMQWDQFTGGGEDWGTGVEWMWFVWDCSVASKVILLAWILSLFQRNLIILISQVVSIILFIRSVYTGVVGMFLIG